MKPIRVSILGATGYGGGELLRLLSRDTAFRIVHATSRSAEGTPVGQVHLNLDGALDLKFSNPSADEIAAHSDVVIGALPHGASAEMLAPFVDQGIRVVDLSGDFRLKDAAVYAKWYKREHPRPDLLKKAVYGCPELNGSKLAKAKLVAAPGCFATAINLALLPAAKKQLVKGTPIVTAMTGSSGSGAEAKPGTHHPTRAGTLRAYKFLNHQHTPEILQLCASAGGVLDALSFVPVSAPIVRGILAIVAVDLVKKTTTQDVERIYRAYYARQGSFVKTVLDREPECQTVAGTNFAEVRPRVGADGRLYVVSAIDNLIKGGAGQAVECLYRMFGLDPAAASSPLSWPGMWP